MTLSIVDLQDAIIEHDIEKIKYLISAGFDVNESLGDNDRVIMDAVGYGNLEIVKVLVEAGAEAGLFHSQW